jgi:hypothetical protein
MIVDPANEFEGRADLAIANGHVAAVGPNLTGGGTSRVIPATDKWVLPGLVDTHVHLASRSEGYRMIARAGVTCALDLAGSWEEMSAGLRKDGTGLTIGFCYPLVPGETVSDQDPDTGEIAHVADQALRQGALGVKILGGHYPLTPDATARAIRVAHDRRAWCAVHAGTQATGSNIEGLEELVTLADGLPLHIAHVNAYCRGQITGDPLVETSRALKALRRAPAARSESYLALINGTSAAIENGVPKSHVTRTCLERGGYPATAAGLERAISDGWARVHGRRGREIVLLPPHEGLSRYHQSETEAPASFSVSFPVNSPSVAVALAVARDHEDFAVDALSTDGGGIPRNVTLRKGLGLVAFEALSLREFVVKACLNPAQMLGLPTKGQIGPGADADVIVVDPATRRAEIVIAGGKLVVDHGTIVGSGGRLLATEAGGAFLTERAVPHRAVAPDWLS